MAVLMEIPSMPQFYPMLCKMILNMGTKHRSPRGHGITEIEDFTLVLDDPRKALLLGVGREMNMRIAAAEAWQLIGAFSDPGWLIGIAPQFKNYAEEAWNGVHYFHGAYGDRIRDQLTNVYAKLRRDPDTRQAAITLWNPELDGNDMYLHMKDYPCTIAMGFSVQGPEDDKRLNMRVTMRSNDAWLGLPYDVFQFTQLQQTLARSLKLNLGTYTHTAWSLHIYDRDVPMIDRLHAPATYGVMEGPTGFGEWGDPMENIVHFAREMHYNPDMSPRTKSEEWYAERN